jgi:hypothetical protein
MVDNEKKKAARKKKKAVKEIRTSISDLLLSMEEQRDIQKK